MNMSNQSTPVVTRFAPSPTGFLHIGGVRTALFAWLYARKHHGTFILRIEDTDKSREVEGSIQHIQDSLLWLGIDWDYGPDSPGPWEHASCLQSERLPLYRSWAKQLIAKGLAYPDPYTNEQVETWRTEAKTANRPFLFRHHRPDTFGEWDGTQPLRFKVPEVKRYTWHDEVRGELSAGEDMLDDFILMKTDGYPTYNFAHIIDDYDMGVTHVMRGEEFISSTPKFLSLYEALEIPKPALVTLPPIMGPDGKKKLSKRDGAKDLLDYKKDGYLPIALRNFLALIGWNPGGNTELFDDEALLDAFRIDKIHKSGGAFNEEKLRWMNREYLQQLSIDEYTDYILAALPENIKQLPGFNRERLSCFAHTIQERVHNYQDIKDTAEAGEYNWAFTEPNYDISLLRWKQDETVAAVTPRLEHVLSLLTQTSFASVDILKEALWPYAEEVGKGQVLWPLRVALTGQERSPDPFTCLFTLGQDEALKRVRAAITRLHNAE